jgi:hypothetical protein
LVLQTTDNLAHDSLPWKQQCAVAPWAIVQPNTPTVCKHANVCTRRQQLNYVTISYPIDQHKFHFVLYKNTKAWDRLGKLELDRLKAKVKSSRRESRVKLWTRFNCGDCSEITRENLKQTDWKAMSKAVLGSRQSNCGLDSSVWGWQWDHLGKLKTDRLKGKVKSSLRESRVKLWTRFYCLGMGLSGWFVNTVIKFPFPKILIFLNI